MNYSVCSKLIVSVTILLLVLALPIVAQGRRAYENNVTVETKTVIDELSRTVVIPKDPQRIVALTSAVMQSLYVIGLPPVGKVEEFRVTEEGMNLPSVGRTNTINIEALYALQPDFIIASSRFHAALKESLEQSGAAVFFFDPDKVGDLSVVDLTVYIGALLGREEVATQYVQSILDLAQELRESIVEPLGIKTAVMIQDGDTITAAQTASSYGAMLKLLGLENIVPSNLPGAGRGSFVNYNIETILQQNPDVIFIVASSNNAASNQALLEKYNTDEQWKHYTKQQGRRFVLLPFAANANRSTIEDMLMITAETLKMDNYIIP